MVGTHVLGRYACLVCMIGTHGWGRYDGLVHMLGMGLFSQCVMWGDILHAASASHVRPVSRAKIGTTILEF